MNNVIQLDRPATWVRFDGIDVNFADEKILPNQCITIKVNRKWDLCDVNNAFGNRTRGVEAHIKGKCLEMEKPRNTHCKLYFIRSLIDPILSHEQIYLMTLLSRLHFQEVDSCYWL